MGHHVALLVFPPLTIVDMGDIVETSVRLSVHLSKCLMVQGRNHWSQSNVSWHHNMLGWGNAKKLTLASFAY